MIVYLAGAIDLVNGKEARTWRRKISEELRELGISTFNPAAAFSYVPSNKATAQKLIDINRSAMLQCDFVIVAMSKDAPSIGTPIELYMLSQMGKPHVVLWGSDGDLPAYVQGLAEKVVTLPEEAIQAALNWESRRHSLIGNISKSSIMSGILSADSIVATGTLA